MGLLNLDGLLDLVREHSESTLGLIHDLMRYASRGSIPSSTSLTRAWILISSRRWYLVLDFWYGGVDSARLLHPSLRRSHLAIICELFSSTFDTHLNAAGPGYPKPRIRHILVEQKRGTECKHLAEFDR